MEKLTRDEIRTIALENGFTLKDQPDGSKDLHPYVYRFAENLLAAASKTSSKQDEDEEWNRPLP